METGPPCPRVAVEGGPAASAAPAGGRAAYGRAPRAEALSPIRWLTSLAAGPDTTHRNGNNLNIISIIYLYNIYIIYLYKYKTTKVIGGRPWG